MWIISTVITATVALAGFSTVITATVALAGFMHALVNGMHKRIDDVRADLNRLHDDHKQLEERLCAVDA